MSKTDKLSRASIGSKVRISEQNVEVPPGEGHSSKLSLSVKIQQDDSITRTLSQENQEHVEQIEQPSGDKSKGHTEKKKKKKYEHLLNDDPIKFRNVSFDHALTAEEKNAKKAAKKAAKTAAKKSKKKGDDQIQEERKASVQSEGRRASLHAEDTGKRESQDVIGTRDSKAEVRIEEIKDAEDKLEKKSQVNFLDLEQPEEPSMAKKKKKGKKTKEDSSKETGSEASLQKSDEKLSKKKDKKGKKTKSQASLTEGSSEKGKKKAKKGKKSKENVREQKSTGEVTDTDETDDSAKKKKKKKDSKIGKSVSWVVEKKKRGKSSSTILRSKSSSLMRVKSKSGSTILSKKLSGLKASMVSMTSGRSEMESKSALSWQESFYTKGKKPKKKKSKKISRSWLFVDEEDSDDEDTSPTKEKKHKKGKKGKKEAKAKESVEPLPKPVKEEKKEDKKPPEVKGEKPKEEKKGKKGKKKKAKESAEAEPAEPEPDDVMAQIMKMKAQAAAQVAGPAEEEAPKEEKPKAKKKKKKGKGKKKKTEGSEMFILPPRKLSQKERIQKELEMLELERIQAEIEAQKKEEEERKRLQEEMRLGKEKDKRDLNEHQLRVEQLGATAALIKNMLEYNSAINNQEKIDNEWKQYLKCDGLPDPSSPAAMNTYLHLWDQVIDDVNVEDVIHRTNEIIELLEELQDFIDDPLDASNHLIADWKWVKTLCREHQQENLDMATYRLLRDIESRLNRIDIPTADFNINDENFKLCLWLYVQLATPMYNPRAQVKKPLEIVLPDMGLTYLLPATLEAKCMAIRIIYVKYDHLTDTCSFYNNPPIPEQMDKDLYETTAEEWRIKMMYKWEHRKPPAKKIIEDADGNQTEITEPEPVVLEGELPPLVPFQKLEPTPSRFELDLEGEMYDRCKENLYIDVDDDVIHLRKYIIIGGVYYLDLFYQPPQPHDQVAFDIRITALQIPKKLGEVPLYIPYKLPIASDVEVKKPPEELEEELKQQEAELDKLIMITLTLPDHVMFLDLPTVCQWDKSRRVWTTADVHDVKHIEEKNYMTFRTGKFGPFALAVNRYINLPFQAWELKPEADGTVTFQLTCAILMVEFNIKNNRICLTQLQNSPNNALQDIVGIYFKLPKLVRILQNGGIDLFPACDAFCYVDGTSEKQWPTEKHLYYNMALLSPSFNFAWSRWNSQTGRRNIVLQMREYRLDKPKQKNHSMLLVTPLRATFIDTTEVSPTFNETPTEGMKFYSDLYHLMKGTSSMATRNTIQSGPQDVAKTLSDLLKMTRVLSFS